MIKNLLEAATNEQQANPVTYVLIVLVIVAMVAYLVWSSIKSKKQQQQAQEQVNNLKVGDRVKTIGGVCGFVFEINNAENTFVLETGTNDKKSYVKFDKGAIYQTAPHDGNANAKAEEKTAIKAEEKVEEKSEEKTEVVEEKTVEKTEEKPKTTTRKKTTKEERREDIL